MKTNLRIHGLDVLFSSSHPWIFRTLLDDLSWFQAKNRGSSRPIRWEVHPLPTLDSQNGYTPGFARYRQAVLSEPGLNPAVTRQLSSNCIVLSHPGARRIEAAVVPTPLLLPDPAFHFLFTQPMSLALSKKSLFFLHAGCVAKPQGGILIVGGSHAGKTTLSLAAVRAGFQFLSDEQPLLAPHGAGVRLLAFPRQIRLDRAGADRFLELDPVKKIQRGTLRLLFSLEKIWPKRIIESCIPRALVFPRYRPNASLAIGRLRPDQAMRLLQEDPHFLWYPRQPWTGLCQQRLPLFRRLTRQVPAYGLHYNDRHLFQIPLLFEMWLRKTS